MFDEFIEKWNNMESTVEPIICRDEALDENFKVFNSGSNIPEIVDEIEDLCCNLFIKNGSPNYENIMEIRKHGFKVYPVEFDSFGWLMAACKKVDTHSIIYFG